MPIAVETIKINCDTNKSNVKVKLLNQITYNVNRHQNKNGSKILLSKDLAVSKQTVFILTCFRDLELR
jgi:hypothetical protein